MITLNEETFQISIPNGDTGTLIIPIDFDFVSDESTAKFTVRCSANKNSRILIQKTASVSDKNATFNFDSQDTLYLDPGIYKWDIRIFGTNTIDTPYQPMSFIIKQPIGQIE